MPKLPVVSGEEAIRAFERLGYQRVRQKGDHVRLKQAGRSSISIPLHDPVKRAFYATLFGIPALPSKSLGTPFSPL